MCEDEVEDGLRGLPCGTPWLMVTFLDVVPMI